MNLRFAILNALLSGIALLGATAAHANTVIDNSNGPAVVTLQPFGSPNTATFGQTVQDLSGPDTSLDSFSMYLEYHLGGSGSLDLRGYVADWDNTSGMATNILYESATQTMNSIGGFQQFTFDTGGLNLVAGNDYVFFLSISNLPLQNATAFGMPATVDRINGTWVFLNNGTDYSALTTTPWGVSTLGYDAYLTASFSAPSSTPLPASLPLLGTGLGALGLIGWRKKRNKAAAVATA